MKALEVLKSPIVEIGSDSDLNLHSKAVVLFATREQIQEAISELEALQQPKSYEPCKGEKMISKELLSEVLGVYVRDGWYFDCELLIYTYDKISGLDENYHAEINIYELAHKCKEWAYKKEYALTPMNDFGFGNKDTDNFKSYWTSCYINLRPSNGTHLYCVEMTSEPEAIFKACEWILKEKRQCNQLT